MTNSDGTKFDLAWYGFDNADESRAATTILAGLNKDQSYTAVCHRKTDNTVDIYLNGALITNKAVIGSANPEELSLGDLSGMGIAGTQVVDSIRVGSFSAVPEPSTIALLATGIFSLLAYAWRKRK